MNWEYQNLAVGPVHFSLEVGDKKAMADASQSNGNLIELHNVIKTYKIESGDDTILKNQE
jgi:hypothetical protein